MTKRGWIVVALALLVVASLATALMPSLRGPRQANGVGRVGGGGTVGLIYIEGTITSSGGGGGIAAATTASTQVMSNLRRAAEDPRVKAIVLRVNSPGGTAAASQEIAEEVERIRRGGTKVVTSMGDVAASGAYWVSASTDLIYANPGTQTGSIGVIMQIPQAEELLRKLGVRLQTVKSGPHKDIGSVDRPLTEDERGILQGMVDDIFDQFVAAVADGRRMSREAVRRLADGRVFTGRQARALGLVDDMGNLHDALDGAARLAGLGKNYQVVTFGRVSPLERLLGAFGSATNASPLDALGRWLTGSYGSID